ncbi:Endo-beta-1,4-glucanase D [Pleurotus pulmonarius]
MLGLSAAALVIASALVPRALAHGGVLSYSIAGTWYDGWKAYNSPVGQSTIQRPWDTYNPIQDPTVNTLACNDDGTSPAGQLTASVTAGSPITAFWNTWPHDTGPVLTYLAQCPGSTCTGVNANSLKWFKIDEAGLLSGSVGAGTWAAGKMIAQNNSWTSTIPASVPSGSYLIRFETIALHSMPAQFYPECAQITITGGGSRAPTAAELVSFPGAYKASDPGITIDLYTQSATSQMTYVIPGPPLYGAAAAPPSNPSPGSTAVPTSPATTNAPSSTAAPGTVAQFGQCGGIGYSGATGCVAPFVCTALNDYYSQCI